MTLGFIWEHRGPTFAYTLASVVALLGALVVWRKVTERES